VFDEVITGLGRTGHNFAAQAFGVTPDVITMAKALTNGAQPMGAVAISSRIHDSIMAAAQDGAIEFFHGYTYSAHPASCAAGLATLDIYRNEGLFERVRELAPYFQAAIFGLKDAKNVVDIRGYGLLAAIDVASDGAPGHRGHEFQKKLFDNGLNLKSTGDCVIVAPPFITTREHIDMMADTLRRTLASL
jgi:beta-alanine--pyruvate transaminase